MQRLEVENFQACLYLVQSITTAELFISRTNIVGKGAGSNPEAGFVATSVNGMKSVIVGKILDAVDNSGDGIIIIIIYFSRVMLHK